MENLTLKRLPTRGPVSELDKKKEGGLLLGIFLGGQTLNELRDSIASAEIELTGGISPRVLPMIDIRDSIYTCLPKPMLNSGKRKI